MPSEQPQDAGPSLAQLPAERLAALRSLRIEGAGLELPSSLVQQLPAPCDLEAAGFADVGDAPALPPAADAAVWAAAMALHLQLLAQLVAQLGADQLELEALEAAGSSADGSPLPPVGGIRIEEMDADAPSAALPASLVLAVALFAADAALQRPWATGEVAAAAQQLLAALAARLPPEAAGRQEQRPGAGLLQEAGTTRFGSGNASGVQPHQQPEDVQRLIALALPGALQRLRPVVAAKVEHGRHTTARLEPYTGPGNFERCCATGQLAWLVRQLSGRHLSAAVAGVLQLVLMAAEDPFPPAQACALWALQHLAAAGQASDLRPHARLVLMAAKRALAGCSDAAWPAAAAAAVAVVSRLEGGNPYAQPYHDVMAVLLDEGELGGHRPERAAAWLAAAPPLFPRLGLQLAAHFARLLPLLLGCCLAPQRGVQAAALAALAEVVRLTWPRVGAHAAVVWGVLRQAHSGQLQLAASAEEEAVATAAEDAALALWYAAGTEFQMQLMTGKGGGEDALLQAVMQRLEEGVSEDQAAAAAAALAAEVEQRRQALEAA